MTESAVDDHATPAEASAALERLESADLLRLEKIARLRARGLPHVEWRDLLHTAVERVVAGTRKWPQHIPIVHFMAGVMRSIASEHWEQHDRTTDAGVFREADLIRPGDGEQEGPIDCAASDTPAPEYELLAKEELDNIEALFIDNDQAWAIVMARTEGYAPGEIQESFDMTATQYASALKHIRRTLLKHTEKGYDG